MGRSLIFLKKNLGWFVIVDSDLLNANIQVGYVKERKACNIYARLIYNYQCLLDNRCEALL
jgi:hypothetical protein